jgi:hypothetical protein
MKIGGVIFGGIFFLAGLVAFYFMVFSSLFDAFQMQSWHSVTANLKRADISSYESSNDDGSSTTMYSVNMAYQYQYQGRSYTGTRADIREESSNDSDKHYQRLYKVKQESAQNQLRVWVNPDDASESIYDRSVEIKFSLMMTLFSSVFMFIGGGIVYSSRKKERPLPAGTTPHPDKPWTTRAQWASSTIFSDAKNKLALIKYLLVLASLFFGMFSIALFGEHPVATVFSILLLLPPFFLFRWHNKKKLEWNHYQQVPLQLNTYPGVIGGHVNGSILIPTSFNAGDSYTFTLKCTHHWTSRSGNETKSHSSIIWTKDLKPAPTAKVNGSYIIFDFEVPADKSPSSKPDNNYHRWTITVNSELKGINFNRDYEVPVFITEDSQTVEDELKEQPLTAKQTADMHARLSVNNSNRSQIQAEMSGSKQSLSLQTPGSNAGWYIAGFGIAFFIIGMVIAMAAKSNFGFVFSAMSTIFIALGVYALGRNCRIQVTPDRLEVDVFLFSKLIKQHVFSQKDIKEIRPSKSSGATQNGKQVNETYGLKLFTQFGYNIDLGGEFKTMKNATHMKLEIEAVLSA